MIVFAQALLVTLLAGPRSPARAPSAFLCGKPAEDGSLIVRPEDARVVDGTGGTLVVATGAVRLGKLRAGLPPYRPDVTLVLDSAATPIPAPVRDAGGCVVLTGRHADVRIGRVSPLEVGKDKALEQKLRGAVKGHVEVDRLERIVTPDGDDLVFGMVDRCDESCHNEQDHELTGILLGPAPAREVISTRRQWDDVALVYSVGGETRLVDHYFEYESWRWNLDRLDAHAIVGGPMLLQEFD